MKALLHLILITTALLLAGCASRSNVEAPPATAKLISAEKLLEIDGERPDNLYKAEIEPGEHTILVEYRTYTVVFNCRFNFTVVPGRRYETVEHSNGLPLRLYISTRYSWVWAIRRKPISPEYCDQYTPSEYRQLQAHAGS